MAELRPAALVTGAAGFIGSHLTRALIASERVSVVALDDLSGGFAENVPPDATFVRGSITDHDLLAQLFAQYRFRYVFHLAAYAAEGLSHFIRRFNYSNNVIGSVNVINEAVRHDAECLVFTSSIAVYGEVQPPMTESQTPHPEDPYGVAKLAVEMDLAAARRMFGLRSVVFRPHNVYGEYQNLGDPYRNVVGIFMRQILSGTPMTVFGDGEQQRAFSYIGDIVPMIAESPWTPDAWNDTFNIGADQPCTVNELAQHVAAAMGVPAHPIEHLPEPSEVKFAFSDHSKAKRVFGRRSYTPLTEGLVRMARWAKSTGVRPAQVFTNIEISRNMPPSWQRLTTGSSSSL